MRIQSILIGCIAFASLSTTNVSATEVDVFNVTGQFGQAPYTNSDDGWANATISVEGNGINRTAHLFHVSYSYATSEYNYWRGAIPVEYVTVNGASSISVNVNTCDINPISGCGQVDFTVETNQPATGWIDNGSRKYSYDGFMRNEVGARQVRFSTSTGTVHGISVNNTRAFSGKYNEVTISLTIGN